MSLLNINPFLNSELEKLSKSDLRKLQTLIDGTSPNTFVYRSLVNVNALLSASDKLSHGVNLELSKKKGIVSGWFLGTSFIQFFANRPEMQMYKINLSDYTYEVVNEPFTAIDLRQAIDAILGGEGGGGSGSEVSGTSDGTNWTSLTIDGETHAIPQGGAEIEYATNADIDALFNVQPEDIPVESIEFVNLPEDHAIELEVGDVIDMSGYIEVSPSDATDKSYTLTTDAPSVLSINGTTITVLQGAEGLNANLTVTANDGSGCYDVMIVDILNGEEPDPEEDVPIQSLRYTDGSGNTCIGFGMLEGEHVDLWTNLEVTPSDATEGVEFMSDDDGIVQVDGTGIATATGSAGESTTITMSSMGDPSIYTTVEISINIPDDEEE